MKFLCELMHFLLKDCGITIALGSNAPVQVRFNHLSVCAAFVVEGIAMSKDYIESYSVDFRLKEGVDV